jgi:hypothetical protein
VTPLVKQVLAVTAEEALAALRDHLLPLFAPETSTLVRLPAGPPARLSTSSCRYYARV